jgi:EmrB/QacA subfamily drug resistance transporter
MTTLAADRRWLALIILCLGDLMIVLDSTVVNVALPSIKADLGFNETTLVWVVNAYLLTYGGLLLLGGRLGDYFGNRRLYLIGIVLFTLASLGCGLAQTQHMWIVARAIQGIGGAIVSAVALALIMNLFTEDADRARAMGIFGFVMAGGGSIGVLLGGLITGAFNWHWIFLINIPVGIIVYILSILLITADSGRASGRLDIAGAATITLSLMLAVYAIVNGNETGWLAGQTVSMLIASVLLLGIFLFIESRVKDPLMPLTLFRLRNVSVSNVISVLWAAAMFAWFFISALYLQQVLGYTPMQVGLAFLPSNLIMAAFSLGLSARVVMRYGLRLPIVIGLTLSTIGLGLFSVSPVDGSFLVHVLPGMLLLGIGTGLALNPVLLAAMSDVGPDESGLASGVVNTAFMMGGAVGLAVLASMAGATTDELLADGKSTVEALNGGYQLAFLLGALCAGIGAMLGALLRPGSSNAVTAH